MKVLVTGGSGVVGVATVNALLRQGHEVRLLSRNAHQAIEQWSKGVEAFVGDISDAGTIRGAAGGCQAVLHVAGIVADEGPDRTLQQININGTRNIVGEAQSSGVRRFVYISSLGADRGESDYHKSKFQAEQLVREFTGSYTIVRLGNVYGPGDAALSQLLKLVRTLPAVPVIDNGDQKFQPIWHEDAAEALATLATSETGPPAVALAGRETTTMNEVLDRFSEITGLKPPRVPLPSFLANLGVQAAEALGLPMPVSTATLQMLAEENVLGVGEVNALDSLGIQGTPLSVGLPRLADVQPEMTPSEGVGALKHRRFYVDIVQANTTAAELFERFRTNFNDFVPIEAAAEPGAPHVINEGTTLTLNLPLRGNIQVRAEKVAGGEITLATLEGHPLAGFVHFRFKPEDSRIRFEIDVYDRAANLIDQIGMMIGGNIAQRAAWIQTAERVVEASGGVAPDGVRHSTESLEPAQAEHIEKFAHDVITRRKRRQENKVG